MELVSWEELPDDMKNEFVRPYYLKLKERSKELRMKRELDILLSGVLLIFVSPILLMISILVFFSSPGPVIFKQIRITQYGRKFKIYKFRTMVNNADRLGTQVTVKGDARVTRIGRILRKVRLDELPQLVNIIKGDMTFVGTRPEVEKYVEQYSDEMKATLLLPAGVTSIASIKYKDEEKLLTNVDNIDETYVTKVLPQKMKYNLQYLNKFALIKDMKIMVMTVLVMVY